jgi:hypothetical protein
VGLVRLVIVILLVLGRIYAKEGHDVVF